ncbi:TMEM175 family protein [Schleiferilactobacillus shenzhenensis]|nr:TMEM175 family protein [Schleiferilactobacillus shenzhenensis]
MFHNSRARLDAISDGVFAVVLTLMVLGIDVPDHITTATMLTTGWKVLIYLISFAVVAQYWTYHQELFYSVKTPPTRLLIMNFYYLVFICLIPFATSFLSNHQGNRVAALLFAAIVFAVDLVQFILFRYVIQNLNGEVAPDAHDREEFRGVSAMFYISISYIIVAALWPAWILVVILLGMLWRTFQTMIWRRLGRRHG